MVAAAPLVVTSAVTDGMPVAEPKTIVVVTAARVMVGVVVAVAAVVMAMTAMVLTSVTVRVIPIAVVATMVVGKGLWLR